MWSNCHSWAPVGRRVQNTALHRQCTCSMCAVELLYSIKLKGNEEQSYNAHVKVFSLKKARAVKAMSFSFHFISKLSSQNLFSSLWKIVKPTNIICPCVPNSPNVLDYTTLHVKKQPWKVCLKVFRYMFFLEAFLKKWA